MQLSANQPLHVKQKIVITGDSHTRNSVAELQHSLGSDFSVTSFVKPEAGMGQIVESTSVDINNLKNGDVLVIWGGSNDIGKNNSKMALRLLCNFIKSKQTTNIVVMTAPPRFDLLSMSCVNSEVIRYNNQFRNRMSQFNNVKLHESNIGRQYFTKHGLHLNSSGKEYIAFRSTALVKSFFHLERMSPIHLKWKGNPVSIDQDKSKNSSVSSSNGVLTP